MAYTVQVQHEYGYVLFVFVLSIFQSFWMAFNVGSARKKYGVEYPAMYSDKSQIFNCIQRVHQNFLEGYPVFLTLLFVGGLKHPLVATAGGVIYIAGRFVYAFGYYTGDPSKRNRGGWFHLGELAMLGSVISLALSLLGVI